MNRLRLIEMYLNIHVSVYIQRNIHSHNYKPLKLSWLVRLASSTMSWVQIRIDDTRYTHDCTDKHVKWLD